MSLAINTACIAIADPKENGSQSTTPRITAGLASVVRWLRKAHVAKHFGVERPTQKLSSFFSLWSIQFSAEYYDARERQGSGAPSLNSRKLETLR